MSLRAQATNAGEGAFEAELRVQLPEDTYYQKALSNIQVGAMGGGTQALPLVAPAAGSVPRPHHGAPPGATAGAGEAELHPQEGEREPRGALRVGQPHEGRRPGVGCGSPAAPHCHPLSLTVTLPAPQITVDMELSVTGLEDVGDAITFQLQLRR